MNLVEILKNKPIGTSLYSTVYGECTLDDVCVNESRLPIVVRGANEIMHLFGGDGKYASTGEVVLFPSKEMRDWSKFAWKKGDVLESDDGRKNVIFDGFTDDTYAYFKGRYGLDFSEHIGDEDSLATQDYYTSDESRAEAYIHLLEKRLGGKLNMDTLEMEPSPKYEFKPFDKVVARDGKQKWWCDFFSIMCDDMYVCVGGEWKQCLPYNEKTAKLIGTDDDYTED